MNDLCLLSISYQSLGWGSEGETSPLGPLWYKLVNIGYLHQKAIVPSNYKLVYIGYQQNAAMVLIPLEKLRLFLTFPMKIKDS